MKKVALVFVLAVFVPSLVLAWLAVRSISDQQIVFERQQTQLFQGVCMGMVKDIIDLLGQKQVEFGRQVETLLADGSPLEVAGRFDEQITRLWALAEVGFVVSMDGHVLAPPLFARKETQRFRQENDLFLSNQESVHVYFPPSKGDAAPSKSGERSTASDAASKPESKGASGKGVDKSRMVAPQKDGQPDSKLSSRLEPTDAEFRQLIGDSNRGIVARFLQNRLKLLMWYRSPSNPQLVFGAQLKLADLEIGLRDLIKVDSTMQNEICLALLDDNGRPIARSHPKFAADWPHPLVSAEIGEVLPHWEVAAYLLNPVKLSQSSKTLTLTLTFLIGLLITAIGIGGWLIVTDLKRQLTLTRQKTDFVSNVSHELKTPLTSIRMFSELLAEGRVTDEGKRRSYLNIITSEVARLTRLINNVLDFARMERGEKKYNSERFDLVFVVQGAIEAYRPQLEGTSFQLSTKLPSRPIMINGDRDALAQVLVNLLSNAEKYSGATKEIAVEVTAENHEQRFAEVRVLDRGYGVPRGCEERIFEQFYRAHDSLSSGIQGSGLGLTLARQMARAHGGEVTYEPRDGGGSCFVLRLPTK
jgi:signal transduction histidine kinase